MTTSSARLYVMVKFYSTHAHSYLEKADIDMGKALKCFKGLSQELVSEWMSPACFATCKPSDLLFIKCGLVAAVKGVKFFYAGCHVLNPEEDGVKRPV